MKYIASLLIAGALAGIASPAYAATTINFGTPSGNLGTTETYTAGGFTIVASGFDQNNVATDLYGKNAGANEIGLGLANDPSGQHEIYFGKGFVQIDVSQLFGKVSNISFFTNSTTQGEQWSIFGSNIAGSYSGPALLSGTNQSTANLPGFGSYKFYDFVSTSQSGGKNFLLSGLTITAVPEPATWAMMLLGFGVMGFGLRRRPSQALAAA